MAEKHTQRAIELAVTEQEPTARVFRNNCGAYTDRTGRLVRYGVANPGGSDLIGWNTITITQEMVGRRVCVFAAIEVKHGRNGASDAQRRFLAAVANAGGRAGVAYDVDEALAILRGTIKQ